jgi:conjugative transfer signal peptidase TraF
MGEPRERRLPLGVWSTAAVFTIAAVLGTLASSPIPLLVWNATPSSPIGLYRVLPARRLRTGDMVIAWPPATARRLAATRHYVPAGVPLVKRVGAVAGDRVCATGRRISLNGVPVAVRQARDPSQRPLPWWSGCRLLGGGDVFLLSAVSPRAFDGRYFGVTHSSDVVGEAALLWPA